MKNFRLWHSTHRLTTLKSNSSNLLNSSFLFFFLPDVLGPSLCLTILLTVDIEDPVVSDVHLNKKF